MATRTTAPPGWYPDPTDPSRQRWWDGTAWAVSGLTPHPAPAPTVATDAAPSAPPRPNQLALASLVLSISWIFFIGSLLGVIFGHLALDQIRGSGGRETGRGAAIAGLIVGYAGLAAGALTLWLWLG